MSTVAQRFQDAVTAGRVADRFAAAGSVSRVVEMLIDLLGEAVRLVPSSGPFRPALKSTVGRLTSVYEHDFVAVMKQAEKSGADREALQTLGRRMFECVVCLSPSRLAVIEARGPKAGKLVEAIEAVPRTWATLRRLAAKVDEATPAPSGPPKVTDVERLPGPPSNPWATVEQGRVRVTGENLTEDFMNTWADERYNRELMQLDTVRQLRPDMYEITYHVYLN